MKQLSHPVLLPFVLLSLIGVFVTGCASVPEGSADLRTQALAYTPPPGKAGLYIIRSGRLGWAGINIWITVDEGAPSKNYCVLSTHSYTYCTVTPGGHRIGAFLENSPYALANMGAANRLVYVGTTFEPLTETSIYAQAGHNYYVDLTLNVSWRGEHITETRGRELVNACKLSGETHFANIPNLSSNEPVDDAATLRKLEQRRQNELEEIGASAPK